MEEVTAWVMERVAKMPRDHKFTLGDRLVETCLSVTELLCEAAYCRDKLPLLLRASWALTRARLLVRLAQRLQLLSMNQREHFTEQTGEIGKMIGGWTRTMRVRQPDPAARPG